jgi:uncharacterized protein (TIGR03435 family)
LTTWLVAGASEREERERMRRILGAVCLLVASTAVEAQGPSSLRPGSQSAEPAFERATITENHLTRQQNSRTGASIDTAGEFHATYMTLAQLIMAAYDVPFRRIVDGPEWIRSDRFDIVAVAPAGFDPDDTYAMIRRLLADRFGLVARREVRRTPTYTLGWPGRSRKPGVRLRTPPEDCEKAEAARRRAGDGGLPRCQSSSGFGSGSIHARRSPMSAFIVVLGEAVGREVIDKTGLRGLYDIELSFTPEPGSKVPFDPPPGADDRSVFTAVREQLGLELEPSTSDLDVLAIERVARPMTD